MKTGELFLNKQVSFLFFIPAFFKLSFSFSSETNQRNISLMQILFQILHPYLQIHFFFFLKKNLSIYSHECHVSNLKRGYNSLVVLTQTTSRKTSLKRLITIMSDKFIDYCSRFSTDQNNILSICCFLILMNSSH